MATPGLYEYIPLDGTQSEKVKDDENSLQTITDYNAVRRSLTTRKGHLTRAKNLVIRDKDYNDKFRLKNKVTYERYLETKVTLEDRWDMLLNCYRRLLQLLPLQTDTILEEYEESYEVFWNSRDVVDTLLAISDPFPQNRQNGQDQNDQVEPREAQPEKVAEWAKALKPTTLTETSHASMFKDFEERLFIFFKANKIFKASPQEQREVARQYLSKNLYDIIRNQLTPELPVFFSRDEEGYVPGEINSMMELLEKEFKSLQPTTNRRLDVFRKKQRAGQSSAAFCSEVVREAQAANMQALTEEDICSLIIINGLTSNTEVEEVLKNFRAEDELDLQVIIESVKTLEKNKRTTGCVSKESEIFQMSAYKKQEMEKRKNYALENFYCNNCNTKGHTTDRCSQRSNNSSNRGRGQGQNRGRGNGRGQNHGHSNRGGSSNRGQPNRGRGRGYSFSNRGQNRGHHTQSQNNKPQNNSQVNTLVQKPNELASLINLNTEGKTPSYLNVLTGDKTEEPEQSSSSALVQNQFSQFAMDPMDFNPNIPLFMQMSGHSRPPPMTPAPELSDPIASTSQEHDYVLDLSKSANEPIETETGVETVEITVDPTNFPTQYLEERPSGMPRNKWIKAQTYNKYYYKNCKHRMNNRNRKANHKDCIRYFSDQAGMNNVQCRIFAPRGSKAWKRAVVSARYELLSKGYLAKHKQKFRKLRINDRVLVRSNFGYYDKVGKIIGFLEHDNIYLDNSRKEKDRCRSVEILMDDGNRVKRAVEHCITLHALDKHAMKNNLIFTVDNEPFDFSTIEEVAKDPTFIFSLVDAYNEPTKKFTESEIFTDSYTDMSSCDERPDEVIKYLKNKRPKGKKRFTTYPKNETVQDAILSRRKTVNILRKPSSNSALDNPYEEAYLTTPKTNFVGFQPKKSEAKSKKKTFSSHFLPMKNDIEKAIEKRPFLEGSCENLLPIFNQESSSDSETFDDISNISEYFQDASKSKVNSAQAAEASAAARDFDGAQEGTLESESRAELPSSQPIQASAAATSSFSSSQNKHC